MKYLYSFLVALLLFAGTAIAADTCYVTCYEVDVDVAFDVSGSWYDPDNPGWGILVDVGTEGTFVAIFTYNFFTEDAGQAWYVGFNSPRVIDADSYGLYSEKFLVNRPTGQFPARNYLQAVPSGSFTFTQFNEDEFDTMLVEWSFSNEPPCVSPMVSPTPPFCKGNAVFVRFMTPFKPVD